MSAFGDSLKKNLASYRHAFNGIKYVIGHENNIFYQLVAAIITILVGYILGLSKTEWAIIILMIGLVLTAETFNTAIEKLADHLHPQKHPAIGLVKDVAAGAVLIIALTAVVIALIIFGAKLI